jgi:hypothetical protein
MADTKTFSLAPIEIIFRPLDEFSALVAQFRPWYFYTVSLIDIVI